MDIYEAIALLKSIVTSIGMKVNEEKYADGQDLIFLGVFLTTVAYGGNECAAGITEARREHVANRCYAMEHWKGSIRIRDLMAFGGLLVFCSQVIFGSKLYLRSIYALTGSRSMHEWTSLSKTFRQDCAWWRTMVQLSGLCGTVMTRFPLSPYFISWDASTSWGIGAFFQGKREFFSIPWKEVLANGGQLGPQMNTPSWHINYMELYAAYRAIRRWGQYMRGCTVPVYTDSSSVHAWLTHLTGPALAIPLLKSIHLLLIKYDIRLESHLIASKINAMADALSRGDMLAFYSALKQFDENM